MTGASLSCVSPWLVPFAFYCWIRLALDFCNSVWEPRAENWIQSLALASLLDKCSNTDINPQHCEAPFSVFWIRGLAGSNSNPHQPPYQSHSLFCLGWFELSWVRLWMCNLLARSNEFASFFRSWGKNKLTSSCTVSYDFAWLICGFGLGAWLEL